jgi:hypothetical protein
MIIKNPKIINIMRSVLGKIFSLRFSKLKLRELSANALNINPPSNDPMIESNNAGIVRYPSTDWGKNCQCN